jgi:hypothetical protein
MDLEEIGCGMMNLTVLSQDGAHWWGFVLLLLNVWLWLQRVNQAVYIQCYSVVHSNAATGISFYCAAYPLKFGLFLEWEMWRISNLCNSFLVNYVHEYFRASVIKEYQCFSLSLMSLTMYLFVVSVCIISEVDSRTLQLKSENHINIMPI